MENHTFSDPEPVVSSSSSSSNGTPRAWQVHVFRRPHAATTADLAASPIATLVIDNDTLPPRKRKQKVVWKLPEDGSLPKFGSIEKERLWELFKAQKKERRKKKEADATTTASTSKADPDDDIGESITRADGSSVAVKGETDKQGAAPVANPVPQGVATCSSSVIADAESSTTALTPPVANGALDKCRQRNGTKTHQSTTAAQGETTERNGTSHGRANGANGRDDDRTSTAATTEAKALQNISPVASAVAAPPPPPPPGFDMSKLSLEDSLASTAPPSATAHPRPPGLASPNMQSPLPHLPPLYISSHAIKQLPVLFTQLLSTANALEWLRYYNASAVSCLQLATAQVVSKTLKEKLQQWKSLQHGIWECQGSTAQAIREGTANGHGDNNMYLVVFSGRTRQGTELFLFCVSLVLQLQRQLQAKLGYQIVNDVLTLTPIG